MAHRIMQRRIREDQLEMHSRNVSSMKDMSSRAQWEDRGFHDAKETKIQNTMKKLQNQDDNNLHARRLRLSDVYNDEMSKWKQECLNNIETPEQRKASMVKRAMELKTRREMERNAMVQEKRMQQYREQCDDLRLLDSKRRTIMAVSGRSIQVAEKESQMQQEVEYEARMAVLWEKERDKKSEREEKDREEALLRNDEVKDILDLQVQLFQDRVTKERSATRNEEAHLITLWTAQEVAEVQKERKLRMKAITRAADVKQFNRQRAAVSSDAYKAEREYDAKLLHLALEREAATEAKEKALLEQYKKEAIEYQEMLRRQMAIEAEDLSYLDEIRKKMEEEVWEKRDAVHNAEATARSDLLKAVLISREEEIQRKIQDEKKQIQFDRVYMANQKVKAQEQVQKDTDEASSRLQASLAHKGEIEKQMTLRRIGRSKEKQDTFLELKRMQKAEAQHQSLVQQMSKAPMDNRHCRKTAEWYFNS